MQAINFGAIHIADEHCLAYMRLYAAMKDFHQWAETPLPYDCLDGINSLTAKLNLAILSMLSLVPFTSGRNKSFFQTTEHELACSHYMYITAMTVVSGTSWFMWQNVYMQSHNCDMQAGQLWV